MENPGQFWVEINRPGAMEALRRLSDKLETMCVVPRTLKSLGRLESDARASDDMFLGEG